VSGTKARNRTLNFDPRQTHVIVLWRDSVKVQRERFQSFSNEDAFFAASTSDIRGKREKSNPTKARKKVIRHPTSVRKKVLGICLSCLSLTSFHGSYVHTYVHDIHVGTIHLFAIY
jgi:hypothetical protein